MTHARVVVRDGAQQWHDVARLVLMDAEDYAPGDRLRVFVTRPGNAEGTDWFEVGWAWVNVTGAGLGSSCDALLPLGTGNLASGTTP